MNVSLSINKILQEHEALKNGNEVINGMMITPLETEFLAIILERKVTYATLYKLFHEMHGSPLAPKEWYEDLKQQIMILK